MRWKYKHIYIFVFDDKSMIIKQETKITHKVSELSVIKCHAICSWSLRFVMKKGTDGDTSEHYFLLDVLKKLIKIFCPFLKVKRKKKHVSLCLVKTRIRFFVSFQSVLHSYTSRKLRSWKRNTKTLPFLRNYLQTTFIAIQNIFCVYIKSIAIKFNF